MKTDKNKLLMPLIAKAFQDLDDIQRLMEVFENGSRGSGDVVFEAIDPILRQRFESIRWSLFGIRAGLIEEDFKGCNCHSKTSRKECAVDVEKSNTNGTENGKRGKIKSKKSSKTA